MSIPRQRLNKNAGTDGDRGRNEPFEGFPPLQSDFHSSSGIFESLIKALQEMFAKLLGEETANELTSSVRTNMEEKFPSLRRAKEEVTERVETAPVTTSETAPVVTPPVEKAPEKAVEKPVIKAAVVMPPFASHCNTIVCRGDSIAKALRAYFPGFNIIDLAENGRAKGQMERDDLSKIPKGAIWVLSAGTNQTVQNLISASPERIRQEAESIVALAAQAREHGGQPFLYDIRQVKDGGYKGGDRGFWGVPENVTKWNIAAVQLNADMEEIAAKQGIKFLKTDGKVEISSDGLHPSAGGLREMAGMVIKSGGLSS